MIFKLIAGVEAHWALLTAVFLHGMRPEMFVELSLVVECLMTVLTLVCFVQVASKYVRLEISHRDHGVTIRTFLRHEVFVDVGRSMSYHGVFFGKSFSAFRTFVNFL